MEFYYKKKHNGVYYLTDETSCFSKNYLSVRNKEHRILNDIEVALLPNALKTNPNYKEWLLRSKTTKKFIRYLQLKENLKILDIGCGNGWFSNKMAMHNNTVLGLDINKFELEQGSSVFRKTKNLQFVYGDVFKIENTFINTFDIITLNSSIQYFKDIEELLLKLKSFLKEEGEIHILDSPFYKKETIKKAKKRTIKYYTSLGNPKMSAYYFHHSLNTIKNAEILYQPIYTLWDRIIGNEKNPFLWLKITKNNVSKGFSKIAKQYESLDTTSSLLRWTRKRVRNHLENLSKTNIKLLEINCGSGIDAVYFAQKGYQVHATDIAKGMIAYVQNKIETKKIDQLSCELLSYTDLNTLFPNNYNHIFSNFGGLNCSSLKELKTVFSSFSSILTSKGKITLVIMPKVCFWEFLSFFKGNKHAFRRLKKGGVLANVEGEKVHTYYYSSKQIKTLLKNDFTNFTIENICFLAPTGNRVDFPEKHPFLFKILSWFDQLSNRIPFLQGIGDYYIISAEKKN